MLYSFSVKIIFLKNFFFKTLNLGFLVFFKPLKSIVVPRTKKTKLEKSIIRGRSEPTITKKKASIFLDTVKKNQKTYDSEFVFRLPETSILVESSTKNSQLKEVESQNKINSNKLEKVLEEYGVVGKIVGYKTGPIVTLYEFIPRAGIKASKVISLADDIARAMSSVSARISSQPGKTSLGIEIPNSKRENVMFGDLIENSRFEE